MPSISETESQTQHHTCLRKIYTKYSDIIAQTTTSMPIQLACGQTAISALLDLRWYINNIYGAGHFITPKQSDSTYHIYHNIYVRYIPEIQYGLDSRCFKPRDIIITTDLLEDTIKEYQFLNTFAEDLEKPKHESTEVEESFFTPPESPQPETP